MTAERTHAALVVTRPGQVEVEQVATRAPRGGEILVTVLCAGICGSDLDMLRGVRPLTTRILGHEGVARVAAAGPGARQFPVGGVVTFLPNDPTGADGTLGVDTEGLFQRYLLVSEAELARGMVVPLVEGIPWLCGPLLEPLATVLYGQALVTQVVSAPESVVIVGAGPIGLLNALYARARGARVILVDTSAARLERAVRHGLVERGLAIPASADVVGLARTLSGASGVGAVYLCTPRSATREALRQALRYVRAGGAISLTAGMDAAGPLTELPGVDLDGIRRANVCGLGDTVTACETMESKRVWLTGHSGASAGYLTEAMRLVASAPALFARVISHIAPYRAAPQVIAQLLEPGEETIEDEPAVKVIIKFTSEDTKVTMFAPTSAQ